MSLEYEINFLKKAKNAVILAHNYQLPEVQDVADFVGDSYGLAKMAQNTDKKIIVFCGVHFMAETASIICPDKTVLLPDPDAGCPMADMITVEKLRQMKSENPDALVLTYINSSALIKSESDVICTSSNALKIVKKIQQKKIIFTPDKYLGSYVAKNNPDKEIILFPGYCNVHAKILVEDVEKLKKLHSRAVVLAHPECRGEVVDLADEVLSTTQMIDFAKSSKKDEFIICTEVGILHKLKNDNPTKIFHHISNVAICPNMKKITLEKVLFSLEDLKFQIKVEAEIREKAKLALDKMFHYAS